MASLEEVAAFIGKEFPHSTAIIESVRNQSAIIRQPVGFNELRPGGTVSGPVLMTIADLALYAAILGEIGIVPLAVTSNLSINFLRKPSAKQDIIARCNLIKLGRNLAVGEVSVFSNGDDRPVAHVVGTYSIPAEVALT